MANETGFLLYGQSASCAELSEANVCTGLELSCEIANVCPESCAACTSSTYCDWPETGITLLQPDGSYVIEGTANIREVNKALGWQLPTDGPKTLNGLILEELESFPDAQVCLQIGTSRLEILEIGDNLITSARCWQQGVRRRATE